MNVDDIICTYGLHTDFEWKNKKENKTKHTFASSVFRRVEKELKELDVSGKSLRRQQCNGDAHRRNKSGSFLKCN